MVEGMEHRDVHTQISALITPSMAMGDVENHNHPCWKGSQQLPELHQPCLCVPCACCVQGGIQAKTPLLLLWALSHIHHSKGLPGTRISAAAKGHSPQNAKFRAQNAEFHAQNAEFHAQSAEFHALSMHPPISSSLTGLKPLPSSHLPLINCFSTQQLDFMGGPRLPSTAPITPSQTPSNPTNHSQLHHRETARSTQPRLREILLGSKRCPKGLIFLLLVVPGAGCIPCTIQQWDGHVLLLLWGRCEGVGDPTEQHRPLQPQGLSPSPQSMRNASTGAVDGAGAPPVTSTP